MKRFSNIVRFPRPEDGMRAALARAPQAEALAHSWMERARPVGERVYTRRRRIATFALAGLAVMLFAKVLFGTNGMVVYRQKRAEYEALKKQIVQVQQENDRYSQKINGLRSDEKAVEKEAREQLGYAKPGEYVYVAPAPAPPAPPQNRSAKK